MTLKKRIFPLLVAGAFIASAFSFNFGIFAQKSDDDPVTYVTEKNNVKTTASSFVEDRQAESQLVKLKKDSEISEDSKVVWIDYSLMNTPNTKDKLLSLYNKGCKIVMRQDDLAEQEVLAYFGLDAKGLYFENLGSKSDLKRVGVFLQKESVKRLV